MLIIATLTSILALVNTSDNCDTSLTVVQSPLSIQVTAVGNRVVTINATDDSGNRGRNINYIY